MKKLLLLILVSGLPVYFGACDMFSKKEAPPAPQPTPQAVVQEPAQPPAPQPEVTAEVTAKEVKQATRKQINKNIQNHDGVFVFTDKDKENRKIRLNFINIAPPVFLVPGKGYIACAEFSEVGHPNKKYDIDFIVNPQGGVLQVEKSVVHMEPHYVDGKWKQVERHDLTGPNAKQVP